MRLTSRDERGNVSWIPLLFERTDGSSGEMVRLTLADYEDLGTVEELRALIKERRPHGKWELVRHMADGAEMKCSVCGESYHFNSFFRVEDHPYCHCGAKMDMK